jgi:hypothetical protein
VKEGEGECPGVLAYSDCESSAFRTEEGRLDVVKEELLEPGAMRRLCRRISQESATAAMPITATPPTTPPAMAAVSVLLWLAPLSVLVVLLLEEWPVALLLEPVLVSVQFADAVLEGLARPTTDAVVIPEAAALPTLVATLGASTPVAVGGVANNVATPPLVAHSSTEKTAPGVAGAEKSIV